MTQSVEEFLAGGTKSATFPSVGSVLAGEIIGEPRMVQRKDYTTSELMFHKDSGKPVMQMVLTVATSLRDPEDPDDDGRRAWFVRGQAKAALIAALRKAGDKMPLPGGRVTVRRVEDKPTVLDNGKPGLPQKIYEVDYVTSSRSAVMDHLAEPSFDMPRAAEAGNVVLPTDAELACPAGVDPARWAALDSNQRQSMYLALGLSTAPRNDEPPF